MKGNKQGTSNPGNTKRKYITPDGMLKIFNEYREWTKENPFEVVDWVGGIGKEVTRKKERPLTIEGFQNYMIDNGPLKNIKDYFNNRDAAYNDFVEVCSYIKDVIRQDQIEGGMACIYNPSITQRLNGLVEKTENKHEVTEIVIKHES